MSRVVRVGIIGCGKIAQVRHIPEYAKLKNVEIRAVCDMNINRAREVADQFKIPQVYGDYRELLQMPDLDAVSICTPNMYHAAIAMEALQKGIHVLVEKPLATTLSDCQEMAIAAEQSHAFLMVGHNQRFSPVHQRVKAFLQTNELGRIYQFSTSFHHGGPEHWSIDKENSWFFSQKEAGFGVIGDLGVHKLDLIHWLLDDEIDEISALQGALRQEISVEDHAVIMARTKKGAIGTISLSWNNPVQEHRTVLYGEHGVLTFGETLFGIQVAYHNGRLRDEEVDPILRPDGMLDSGVIQHFVQCIREGKQPETSASAVLPVMDAIFRLAKGHSSSCSVLARNPEKKS